MNSGENRARSLWGPPSGSRQNNPNISEAKTKDSGGTGIKGRKQEEEKHDENGKLSEVKQFLGCGDCRLELIFEVVNSHASVRPLRVTKSMLLG